MEWVSGNNFIRPNHMKKAGDVIHGHAHNFDHTSICMRGAVRVVGNGREVVLRSPTSNDGQCHILIKAGVEHEITALEDDTVFWCVYAHRTPQGDIVQEYTGWSDAYV
jgi:quercetin dioxygenase-like cupin family protein